MGHLIQLGEIDEVCTPEGRWQPLNIPAWVSPSSVSMPLPWNPVKRSTSSTTNPRAVDQEAYVVVSGRAGFRVADQQFEAGPGDVVVVADPAERRDYWALEPATRIVCVGPDGAEHPYGEWIGDSSGT